MKTLLIDGNSLINRAFYALPVLSTTDGVYTNAVYGFLKMFYKAVDEYAPDNIVCAFDLKSPTFRHKRYPEYKAGRKKMPEELVPQIPLLREILTSLGVKCVSIEGFEADDIIGTYALLSDDAGGETAIITGDRDSFQLISGHTSVWYTKKGISDILKLSPDNIKENYGVTEKQVCDLKGLMGDSSDNIPGIAGVGEKTALTLLEKYGTLESVLEHADEVKGKLGEKLRDGREAATESKFLATIVRDVPVEPLSECAYKPVSDEVAAEIFAKYQFKSLLERVGAQKTVFEAETLDFCDLSFVKNSVAVYITDQAIFIASDEKKQYRISLTVDLLTMGMTLDNAVEILRPVMENENVKKYFYDCKSAMKLWDIKNICGDIMLAEYLLDAGGDDFSFAHIAERYSVAEGASAVLSIHAQQEKSLEAQGMTSLYFDMELPLAAVLDSMEKTGFCVDVPTLRLLGSELSEKLSALTGEIYALADKEFNINSPQQLGNVLFEDLGLPAKKKNKRGYSTDNDVLEQLEHPIIPLIMEYRQLQKLKSTYIDAMFGLISSDGRIHSTFNQAVTATGRISSTEPNLQNIPVRYEAGRAIRKAFVAEKGCVLVNADYSQIELRILAHLSGDETLIDSFRNNEDIHARTAAEVLGIDISEVTKEQRGKAKAVNFGIIYGISDFGLAKSINSSRKEAKEFIEKYFERYPSVKRYLDECVSEAKRSGCAKTVFSRKRSIPQLKAENFSVRAFGERVAMNTPIQGSAADIIKLAMLKVYDELQKEPRLGRLILQVHDELIIETDENNAHDTEKMLKSVMESVAELSVPLVAETNVGRTWFDLK